MFNIERYEQKAQEAFKMIYTVLYEILQELKKINMGR